MFKYSFDNVYINKENLAVTVYWLLEIVNREMNKFNDEMLRPEKSYTMEKCHYIRGNKMSKISRNYVAHFIKLEINFELKQSVFSSLQRTAENLLRQQTLCRYATDI